MVKHDVVPYALYTMPAEYPFHYRRRAALNAHHSSVDDPSPWCIGMVVVPKSSGPMRICNTLNQNVLMIREYHPLLKVNYILAQLIGAKKFILANPTSQDIPITHNLSNPI